MEISVTYTLQLPDGPLHEHVMAQVGPFTQLLPLKESAERDVKVLLGM